MEAVNFEQLEAQLADNQWINGYYLVLITLCLCRQLPGEQDRTTYERVKGENVEVGSFPNVFAWVRLVSRFADDIRNTWGAPAGGKKEEGKAAPAKKGAKAET
jgi:hypothetical protein